MTLSKINLAHVSSRRVRVMITGDIIVTGHEIVDEDFLAVSIF